MGPLIGLVLEFDERYDNLKALNSNIFGRLNNR